MTGPREAAAHFCSLAEPTELDVSPDGSFVVVTGAPNSRTAFGSDDQVLLAAADGAARSSRWFPTPGRTTLPSWHPRRNRLAFGTDTATVVTNVDTGARHELAIPAPASWVGWSATTLMTLCEGVRPTGQTSPDVVTTLCVWMLDTDQNGEHDEDWGTPSLISLPFRIWEACASPAGSLAMLASSDPSDDGWLTASLVVRTPDGVLETLGPSSAPRSRISISQAGDQVGFVQGFYTNHGLGRGQAEVWDVSTDRVSVVPTPADVDVTWTVWDPKGNLFYGGWRGLESVAGRVLADTGLHQTVGVEVPQARLGSRHAAYFSLSPDGQSLVAIMESPSAAPEIWSSPAEPTSTKWTQLTQLNRGSTAYAPRVRPLSWKSSDGTRVEGLLLESPREAMRSPSPFVVIPHGGPTGLWPYAYTHKSINVPFAQILCALGMTVLLPNARGSSGRGEGFARGHVGDVGGREVDDVLTGVQWCLDNGIATPGMVGALGGSWGGFLSSMLTARSDLFAASVVVSGISDWNRFFGEAVQGKSSCRLLFEGPPEERARRYLQGSPLTIADRIRTPTLFMHGDADTVVPPNQTAVLAKALRRLDVEIEEVTYPGEGHGFQRFEHRVDAAVRAHEWLMRHMPATDERGEE